MKSRHLISAFVAAQFVLVASHQVIAQQEAPSQFEHIQGLEPLVGFWRTESGTGPEGSSISMSCRWIGNQNYLQMQVSPTATAGEGRPPVMGTMLVGRDFAKDQVTIWSFWDDRQAYGTVKVGEGSATWNVDGMQFDGRKTSSNVALKVEDDQLTVDISDIKVGDETRPDMQITFMRTERRGRGRAGN